MKKGLLAILVAGLLMGATEVNALTKDELRSEFAKTYIINDKPWKLDTTYLNQIDRYLETYDLSEKDADFISDKIKDAVSIIEKGDAKSIEDLKKSEKEELSKLVSDINNNTSVQATVKGGSVVIYDPITGNEFTRITPPAKQTGIVNYVVLASGIVLVVSASTLVIKRVKSETV